MSITMDEPGGSTCASAASTGTGLDCQLKRSLLPTHAPLSAALTPGR